MKRLWRKVVVWLDVFADNKILQFQIKEARTRIERLAGENARLRTSKVDALNEAGQARHAAEEAQRGEQAARTLLEQERGVSAERRAEIEQLKGEIADRETVTRKAVLEIERLQALIDGNTKPVPGMAIYPPRSETR